MKNKTEFVCTECGYRSAKWYGKCPGCDSWNTMEETEPQAAAAEKTKKVLSHVQKSTSEAVKIQNIEIPKQIRIQTGINEFDRVLGGGIVQGSVVLLSGEPGIGKSTMLLQVCACLGKNGTLLYVSGEESQGQIKLRAKRLEVMSENLYILTETEIGSICDEIEMLSPEENVMIV